MQFLKNFKVFLRNFIIRYYLQLNSLIGGKTKCYKTWLHQDNTNQPRASFILGHFFVSSFFLTVMSLQQKSF